MPPTLQWQELLWLIAKKEGWKLGRQLGWSGQSVDSRWDPPPVCHCPTSIHGDCSFPCLGGLRLILDLWAPNRHLTSYSFRMWTHTALLCFVCPGDWFTSVSLKDAYHNNQYIPLTGSSWDLPSRAQSTSILVLLYGLSLSPTLRKQGIHTATMHHTSRTGFWLRSLVRRHWSTQSCSCCTWRA